MTEITGVRYLNAGNHNVSALFDGVERSVPVHGSNPHWREIARRVEAKELTIAPYSAPSTPARRIGKPREFLYLFSDAEKSAFFAAKQQNVDMDLWWALASTGDFSLDHPSVEPGLSLLVQEGILTEARKAEIQATDFNQVSST